MFVVDVGDPKIEMNNGIIVVYRKPNFVRTVIYI